MENSKKGQDLKKKESTHFWNLIEKEFTLNSRHLSDIKEMSDGLPNGVFYKRYTGIGATRCELEANRHSILVFPYIKLALEKAQNYGAFYVGSNPNNSKSAEKITPEDISSAIRNRAKPGFLKFCVVADSIEKVIKGIELSGMNPYKDFMLVLDEVEVLQLQSGLRDSLPVCMEYFLKFENKCLVSATMIKFNNAEINKLDSYSVELGWDNTKEIEVYRYEVDPHIALANELVDQFNEEKKGNRKEKVFIGLNSTNGIKEMISIFEQAGYDDIAVLCSENSSDNFDPKYTKEITGKVLPSRINLATSAYWSGIDIEELYIPYAVSLNTRLHHLFTIENLIQFSGRCRKPKNYPVKLLLPSDIKSDFSLDAISAEKRLKDLEDFISSIEVKIESKKDQKAIKLALSKSKGGLIYKSIDGSPKPNWLLGDFEAYRANVIRKLKDNGNDFLTEVGEYFKITKSEIKEVEMEIHPESAEIMQEKKLDIFLSHLNENYSDFRLIAQIEKFWSEEIRVAAFWYLFGRKLFKDEDEALKLAKRLVENKKKCVLISKILLEGIRFYSYHQSDYKGFEASLIGNQKGFYDGDSFNQHIKHWSKHFPETIKSSTNSSFFLKYFFEIEPKKSGGKNRFNMKPFGGISPFFNRSNYCKKVLDSLGTEPKPSQKLSKMNFSAKYIINYQF